MRIAYACSQAWQSTADTKQMTKVRCIVLNGELRNVDDYKYHVNIVIIDPKIWHSLYTETIANTADDKEILFIQSDERWLIIYYLFRCRPRFFIE